MKLLVSKLHYPVEVLGPGRRAGIWVQGCTIRCFGCISRDTWPADPRYEVDVSEVLAWVAGLPTDSIEGITISGGEPFDQAEALQFLLEGLDAWRRLQPRAMDVLAFSGRAYSELETQFATQLARLDAVVTEPYVHGMPTDLPLRGSANQQLVPLSDLGRLRYEGAALEALGDQRHQIQLAVDDASIWMIGIPEQGTMRRVQSEARAAGIELRRPSWLV